MTARPSRSVRLAALTAIGVGLLLHLSGRAAELPAAAETLRNLRDFREMGSVLYVAAHPDDENTLLIGYLARGKNYRTAYLSVTRGDGGQNVLGPDFGEKLGVARTQELLAARRLDGGRQFFTRAVDFGFSKDYHETLGIWDRQQVLADIVRVIRTFRPDVVITRFAPWPTGTHGHHTASAVLALEAFKEAGDPDKFPDQLTNLAPWQPKRIFMNGLGNDQTNSSLVQMEISGNDPVLGISFGDLAGRSRSMHKTQGFGNYGGGDHGSHTESFRLLAGDPATNDIMDGIDTTWNRVPGGADIGKMTDDVIAQFQAQDPAASVPALLKLRAALAALTVKDSVVDEKRLLLDRILQACLGLEVRTTLPEAEVVPGQTLNLQHTVQSGVPVRWLAVRYPGIHEQVSEDVDLSTNQSLSRSSDETLPASTPLSQPYWLREEGTPGMFRVDDASLIGQPENPPVFPVEFVFEVNGQTVEIPDQPVQMTAETNVVKKFRRLDVIPPVSLSVDSDVAIFNPGWSHSITIGVTAARPNSAGNVQLAAPPGWSISPPKQSFSLVKVGDQARFQFKVTAPAASGTAKLIATAEIGGAHYQNERLEINYPHIPRQLLQPLAAVKAVSVDLQVRSRNIGYLPGAGDSIPDDLKQMGCTVTTLDDGSLTAEKLRRFDAVVIGVRAYNVRPALAAHLPGLFEYVQNGGTVVAQYNRPDRSMTNGIAPYRLHLSGQRVTDETAGVTFLAPDHPALNTPNKITAADFAGWIQERGIYFPDQWDDHFTPILAWNDPGEDPLKGSLLVAQYGKGYFVYTGIVFFRELPAGVPGAYRLFANLISLGK
jgi:LmbE family N-acetylglucosaminyl deacetylase